MSSTTSVSCDVLVIGAGAGGLAAAVTARKMGLDTLVIEKERWIGGTTALSGGWLWIPCSPLAQRAGIADSTEAARAYLRHELGEAYDERRVSAYLDNGPRMAAFFERETSVRFFLGASYPDYHPDSPGALSGGRAICAEPFDARALGEHIGEIRPPSPELTLFGIKVGSGPDFRHFANAQRSLRSAVYVLGRVAAHVRDTTLHGRDLKLMSGSALIARLARSAYDLQIPIWTSCTALELFRGREGVGGAVASRSGVPVRIIARRAVILAAGGFSRDPFRRDLVMANLGLAGIQNSLAASGNTGDGIRMAINEGAAIAAYRHAAAWMPVSHVLRPDGSVGLYPHTFDRGKPGIIAVGRDGRRFVNESDSYHDVGAAMIERRVGPEEPIAFLIGDHRAVRRYGLGFAKPFPVPLTPYLRSGYLKRARSLAQLARAAGIEETNLESTVAAFNTAADKGEDPQFGRGGNPYNRYNGDPIWTPNPCLAPLQASPFYAVKVHAGDLSTFNGVRTDENARVLNEDGKPIAGLYACGSDMASIFAGHYPGPGINIGSAMTFGYIAARHLARNQH